MAVKSEFTSGIPTLGGAMWIDLLNSRFLLPTGPVDLLRDKASCAHWKDVVGLAGGPTDDDERLALIRLRATLDPAFEALRHGAPPAEETVSALNAILATRKTHKQMALRKGELILRDHHADAGSTAAATLAEEFSVQATNAEKTRFKRCENPACSLVFYDRGRNNRRRWCSTSVCGNRHKVATYRARKSAG